MLLGPVAQGSFFFNGKKIYNVNKNIVKLRVFLVSETFTRNKKICIYFVYSSQHREIIHVMLVYHKFVVEKSCFKTFTRSSHSLDYHPSWRLSDACFHLMAWDVDNNRTRHICWHSYDFIDKHRMKYIQFIFLNFVCFQNNPKLPWHRKSFNRIIFQNIKSPSSSFFLVANFFFRLFGWQTFSFSLSLKIYGVVYDQIINSFIWFQFFPALVFLSLRIISKLEFASFGVESELEASSKAILQHGKEMNNEMCNLQVRVFFSFHSTCFNWIKKKSRFQRIYWHHHEHSLINGINVILSCLAIN